MDTTTLIRYSAFALGSLYTVLVLLVGFRYFRLRGERRFDGDELVTLLFGKSISTAILSVACVIAVYQRLAEPIRWYGAPLMMVGFVLGLVMLVRIIMVYERVRK